MKFKNPLVSAVIPVFNGEVFLDECLKSIFSQEYSPIEIIVVDDGSGDRTKDIALEYGNRIKYIYQENQGPSAARNHGLKRAAGELIGFLDADDLWPKDKLRMQVDCFRSSPGSEAVLGLTQLYILDKDSPETPVFKAYSNPWLFQHLGCALFKKSLLDKIGFFDSSLHLGEDTDFFLRMREQHTPLEIIDKVTLKYRLHQSNMTKTADFTGLHLDLFKRSIDRRRSQNQGTPDSLPMLSSFRKKGPR